MQIFRCYSSSYSILNNEKMRGKTLHEILGCVNERDDALLRSRWALATGKFEKFFVSNEFGSECSVCDRWWFASDVKRVLPRHAPTLLHYFPKQDVKSWVACSNCYRYLEMGEIAPMCKWFGFEYPLNPHICHRWTTSVRDSYHPDYRSCK